MPHPDTENRTPYAFASVFVADAELRPLFVPLVQATVSFARGREGDLAAEQDPIHVGGVPTAPPSDSEAEASFLFEPQLASRKLGTDVVLHGHAWPEARRATEQIASLQVGSLGKSVRVVGDRVWQRSFGLIRASRPAPIDGVPLLWERAFGGWDRSHENPARHVFEARNPVGRGFRRRRSGFEEGIALPNLEDPKKPLRRWGSTPEPHGFGFVSPGWKPRVGLAGTYDARWIRDRQPGLPQDFDPRFWNAAPRGLASGSPLRGDEAVEIAGVSKRGRLSFRLPALSTPRCRVQLARGADQVPALRLDTIVLDVDRELALILWRGFVAVRDGPQDVAAIEITRGADHELARGARRAA
jgi:hypothetical protein